MTPRCNQIHDPYAQDRINTTCEGGCMPHSINIYSQGDWFSLASSLCFYDSRMSVIRLRPFLGINAVQDRRILEHLALDSLMPSRDQLYSRAASRPLPAPCGDFHTYDRARFGQYTIKLLLVIARVIIVRRFGVRGKISALQTCKITSIAYHTKVLGGELCQCI